MEVFERRLGFQAGMSSIMNIFFKALIYDETVSSLMSSGSFVFMSSMIVGMLAIAPCNRAYERISLFARNSSLSIPSTLEMSERVMASKYSVT